MIHRTMRIPDSKRKMVSVVSRLLRTGIYWTKTLTIWEHIIWSLSNSSIFLSFVTRFYLAGQYSRRFEISEIWLVTQTHYKSTSITQGHLNPNDISQKDFCKLSINFAQCEISNFIPSYRIYYQMRFLIGHHFYCNFNKWKAYRAMHLTTSHTL